MDLGDCRFSSLEEGYPQYLNIRSSIRSQIEICSEYSDCPECLECSECSDASECSECSDCEEDREDFTPNSAPSPDCLEGHDQADCEALSYCEICGIDDSELSLLGQTGKFWSLSPSICQRIADVPSKRSEDVRPRAVTPDRDQRSVFPSCAEPKNAEDDEVIPQNAQLPVDSEQVHTGEISLPASSSLPRRSTGSVVSPRRLFEAARDNTQVPSSSPVPAASRFSRASSPATSSDICSRHELNGCHNSVSPSTSHSFPRHCQWDDPVHGVCGAVFATPEDLHNHLRKAHNISGHAFCRWNACKCGHKALSPHRFSRGIVRHCWGHSGYRPYKCSICQVGFAAAEIRDEHCASVHFGRKLHSCDVSGCTHRCSSLSNLRRHKQDKHGSGGFQCQYCKHAGKRTVFSRAGNLVRHFRSCKAIRTQFPLVHGAASGTAREKNWFPPGHGPGGGGLAMVGAFHQNNSR